MNTAPDTRHALVRILFALCATLLVGCATAPSPSPRAMTFDNDDTSVTLRVVNRQYFDMRIYVLRGGVKYRLGYVDAFQSREFRLPASLGHPTGSLSFLADPLGGGRVMRSDQVPVWGGRTVQWEIGYTYSTSAILIL